MNCLSVFVIEFSLENPAQVSEQTGDGNFSTAATILLLALTILGASFQIQINNFLENTTVSRLAQDSEVVANLASAYGMVGNLHSRELLLNLDVVSQITNADIVICDNEGYIILCSGDLGGGNHDGWQINQDFLDKVYQSGSYSATGTIRNLYEEERFVVSAPSSVRHQLPVCGHRHRRAGLLRGLCPA